MKNTTRSARPSILCEKFVLYTFPQLVARLVGPLPCSILLQLLVEWPNFLEPYEQKVDSTCSLANHFFLPRFITSFLYTFATNFLNWTAPGAPTQKLPKRPPPLRRTRAGRLSGGSLCLQREFELSSHSSN